VGERKWRDVGGQMDGSWGLITKPTVGERKESLKRRGTHGGDSKFPWGGFPQKSRNFWEEG